MRLLTSFAAWVLAVFALTDGPGESPRIRSFDHRGDSIVLKTFWPSEAHRWGGWQEIYFAPTLTSAWALVERTCFDLVDETANVTVPLDEASRASGFFKVIGEPNPPDPWEIDSDGDGLPDGREIEEGTDPYSPDTDNDGVSDFDEIAWDTDPLLPDTDGDGAEDWIEIMLFLNPRCADTDGDTLPDGLEIELGSNAASTDSDCDGLPDAWEYEYGLNLICMDDQEDPDGDGVTNYEEMMLGTDPTVPNVEGDSDGDGLTDEEEEFYMCDPWIRDTDGDGLSDYDEVNRGTNPCNRDSDGDGLDDAKEVRLGLNPISPDTDNDLMTDDQELAYGFDPKNRADAEEDPDGDGLTNADEIRNATDPFKADTDSDGATDKWEIDNGFDPLNPADGAWDSDGDGLTNAEECRYGTDPYEADADRDGLPDGLEIELGSSPTNAYSLSETYDDSIMYHSRGMDPFGSPADSPYSYWQHAFYTGSATGEVRLPISTKTNAVLSVSVIGSGFGEVEIGDQVVALMGNGTQTNHNELLVSVPRGRRLGFYQRLPTTLQVAFDSDDFALGQLPYDPSPSGWIVFPDTEATLPCIHDLNGKSKVVSMNPCSAAKGLTCTWHGTGEIDVRSLSDLSAVITCRFPVKERRELSHTVSHAQALFGAKTFVQTARFCPCEEEEDEEPEEEEGQTSEESDPDVRECWCLGAYCTLTDCECPCHARIDMPTDDEELEEGVCPVHEMPLEECEELHREGYSNAVEKVSHPGIVLLHDPSEYEGKRIALLVPAADAHCCECPEHNGRRVTLAAKSGLVDVLDDAGAPFVETTEDCEVRIVGRAPSTQIGDAAVAFCRNGKIDPSYKLTVLGVRIEAPTEVGSLTNETEITLVTDVGLPKGDVHVALTSENGHFQLWYQRTADLRELLLDSRTQPTFDTDIRSWRKMLKPCTDDRRSKLILVKRESGRVRIEFGFAVEAGECAVKDLAVQTIAWRQPYLVFDYDRNGTIDDADFAAAKAETPFTFWVNDDGDSGDVVAAGDYLSDLPGSGANCRNGTVDGLRDLVDFTPVAIDLRDVLAEEDGAALCQKVKWRLKSDCVKAVWTELSKEDAGAYRDSAEKHGYGVGCGEAPESAASVSLAGGVGDFPEQMEKRLREKPGNAVFLIEGVKPGVDLMLEGWVDDESGSRKVFETRAPLHVTSVENMYRHISIRAAAENLDAAVMIPEDPENALCLKEAAGDLYFVHGFNVNHDEGRVWFAEVFKRLWQSGSNARFNGIEWSGDYHATSEAFNAVHYQRDVYHALMSAAALKRVVEAIPSSKRTLLAHSLGNMLVSEALRIGLNVDSYVMLNAAVPSEAYNGSFHNATEAIRRKYVPDDWRDYPARSWAANWHTWFPDDDRGELGWTGRYENLGATARLAYYTPEDEVFEEDEEVPSLLTNVFHWPTLSLTWPFVDLSGVITLDSYAWQKSEVCKGVDLIAGSFSGGWGFHDWSGPFGPEGEMRLGRYSAAEAAQMVADGTIVDHPVFDRGQAAMFRPAISRADRYHILAYNIPAVSSAAGIVSDGLGENETMLTSLNLERGEVAWRHSGLKNLSYWHVRNLYDRIAERTGVR